MESIKASFATAPPPGEKTRRYLACEEGAGPYREERAEDRKRERDHETVDLPLASTRSTLAFVQNPRVRRQGGKPDVRAVEIVDDGGKRQNR